MRYRWSDYRRSLSGLLHVCHAKYAWQSDWAHSSWLCLVFSSLTINSFTILVYNTEKQQLLLLPLTTIVTSEQSHIHLQFTTAVTSLTLRFNHCINRKQVILCFPFSTAYNFSLSFLFQFYISYQ